VAPRIRSASLADRNERLIHLYGYVRDDLEGLVDELATLDTPDASTRETYDRRRAEYNDLVDSPPSLRRAALFVYLNRTCYNGLYRVNSKGLFNVPVGRYSNPRIVQRDRLEAASKALRKARTLTCADFEPFLLATCRKGDFVYLDPPYVPVSTTARFTSYERDSFGPDDQRRLAGTMERLHRRGVRWLLSNSFTDLARTVFVEDLLPRIGIPVDEAHVHRLRARRSINSRSDRRGAIWEYAVRNYEG